MRYVTVDNLKAGQILACLIYGSNLETLLTEGTALEETHIRRINDLGYAGVYIDDKLSRDIEVLDLVPAELRLQTIKAAMVILQTIEKYVRGKSPTKVPPDLQRKLFMPLIETLIRNRRRLVDRVDLKPYDNYAFYHAANVVILSLLLGIELGLTGPQLYELGFAALLYDVGVFFIPKTILKKPGRLTQEEYEIVKKHTALGFEYLREGFDLSIEACMGALQHHEHYDGSGYPNGLKKGKISIYGRIIAVADAFDALTSRRPYRQPMSPVEAIEYISLKTGTTFDPYVVESFRKLVAPYPSGFCVELDNGADCIVIQNYKDHTDRPCVRLLDRRSDVPLVADLYKNPHFSQIKVSRIINY